MIERSIAAMNPFMAELANPFISGKDYFWVNFFHNRCHSLTRTSTRLSLSVLWTMCFLIISTFCSHLY